MTKYGLFLGCTTPTKVPQYEMATRWTCRRLGIELVDVGEFVCCGSNQANITIEGGLLLSALNMAHAEARGLDIVVLCAACFGTLSEAAEKLRDPRLRDDVNSRLAEVQSVHELAGVIAHEIAHVRNRDIMLMLFAGVLAGAIVILAEVGLRYEGKTRVRHISRVFYEDVGLDRLRREAVKDLSGLKIAPHYGCHSIKPRAISRGFDNPDHPKSLHRLIRAAGGNAVDYKTLDLCCGGKTFPNSQDLTHALVARKLDDLQAAGVDCMVVQCQTCYLMYGPQQANAAKKHGKTFQVPVLLYPQLLGLAMGADPVADLGLHLNAPSTDRLLKRIARNAEKNWARAAN